VNDTQITYLTGKADGRGQMAEGIYSFPGVPEPSGRPEEALGLSPPQTLVLGASNQMGPLSPSVFDLLPSSNF
jgi:hypothetical protein